MELVRYQNRPKDWDKKIASYDSKTLFHESCWHDHILSIHKKGRIEYFEIKENTETVGYFCGLLISKCILKIYGSPLKGTGSNYMGPVINKGIDQDKLITAIEAMCRRMGIVYLEICNDILSEEVMQRHNFEAYHGVTHKVEIGVTREVAFANLKSTCRNRIRRGLRNKLTAEITDRPSIVDIYFDQLKEVYGKQGLGTPFTISRVKTLYDSLYSANRLLAVWVKDKDQIIATGLFPYDENAIYYWGGGSWLKYQQLYPNELLHWAVVEFGIGMNIGEYNMCGGTSQFKNKFGGHDVPHIKYYKTYIPWLKPARDVYLKYHFLKLRIKGLLNSRRYSRKERVG